MQQRNKRLAVIWIKTYLSFVLMCAGLLSFIALMSVMPDTVKIAVLIVMVIGGIGFVTFNIAKLRLETEERDQLRVLRSLSKGYDE